MLQTLSTEVIQHIASLLEADEDRFALRLVCRQLYVKSVHTFADIWFSVSPMDFSPWHLDMLDRISRHEVYRGAVRQLRVGIA